MFDFKPEYIKD